MSQVDGTKWLPNIAELKRSYRGTHRGLQKAKDKASPADKEAIEEMIADVNYAIEWMHTGKQPGNKRGIERRAAYQREKLMDPLRMQSFMQHHSSGSPANLSEDQRFQIESALSVLSGRERECFELHHGMCYSYAEIATFLCVKKGTVQGYVESARKKLKKKN